MERKLALIVGNDRFEDPHLACLVSPASDVRALADLLRDPQVGGYDEVTTLVNEPETQVRRGIASLFARRQPDDLLLLYFSTHGLLDENGRLFIAARDTQRDLLKATAISAAFVTDEMDNCLSRRQVLILDCCHSGAFARGTKGALGASVGTATAFEGNGFGRVVLTATDSTQYAWDGDQVLGGDLPTSVFTRHLIEGLRTGAADEDDDGRISLDELYEYVFRQVLKETRQQTPRKWSYNQQGTLIIARNPYPGRKRASFPDPRKALESDSPAMREGAIRELERNLRSPQAEVAKAAEQILQEISTEDDSRKIRQMASAILADFRKPQKHRESSPAQTEISADAALSAEPSRSDRRSEPKIVRPAEENVSPTQTIELGLPPKVAPREPDGAVGRIPPVPDLAPPGAVQTTQAPPPTVRAEKKLIPKSPQVQKPPSAQPESRPTETASTKTPRRLGSRDMRGIRLTKSGVGPGPIVNLFPPQKTATRNTPSHREEPAPVKAPPSLDLPSLVKLAVGVVLSLMFALGVVSGWGRHRPELSASVPGKTRQAARDNLAFALPELITYAPGNRRDPFESLLVETRTRELRGPRPEGIPGLLIDEIDLTGIWKTSYGYVAQFVASNQKKTYLLKKGDQLYDGDVVSINKKEIVFRQIVQDPTAVKPFREVVKSLVPPP